jgi:hypothetical protein
VNVSRQFKADFDLVCAHYECLPDEVELMKQCAERDIDAAIESFGLMAREPVEPQVPERYLDASAYLRMGSPLNQEKADVNGRDRRAA